MNKRLTPRRLRILAICALALLIPLLTCAWYFRIWSWHDYKVYTYMRDECHPVWRELHFGRIHAGQNIDDIITATNPVRIERMGDFTMLHYAPELSFTNVHMIAYKGRVRVAEAASCTWGRTFFDSLNATEREAYRAAYIAHMKTLTTSTAPSPDPTP